MKRCSHDGSTNGPVRGDICITHGAKVERKHCSLEGCATFAFAQKGGVCKGHCSTIINANNDNAMIQQNVDVTLAIPSRESINHEEEE